jgi:hypothetical protein
MSKEMKTIQHKSDVQEQQNKQQIQQQTATATTTH